LKRQWLEDVKIVFFGPSERLLATDEEVAAKVRARAVGRLRVRGVSWCYTCGHRKDCAASSVVARNGFLDEIKGHLITRIPAEFYKEARVIANKLGTIVREKRERTEKLQTMKLPFLLLTDCLPTP
ncbi:MAG: hypothetical protein JSV27_09150, partial [Candidatus Bathyarchaeota archaeon]